MGRREIHVRGAVQKKIELERLFRNYSFGTAFALECCGDSEVETALEEWKPNAPVVSLEEIYGSQESHCLWVGWVPNRPLRMMFELYRDGVAFEWLEKWREIHARIYSLRAFGEDRYAPIMTNPRAEDPESKLYLPEEFHVLRLPNLDSIEWNEVGLSRLTSSWIPSSPVEMEWSLRNNAVEVLGDGSAFWSGLLLALDALHGGAASDPEEVQVDDPEDSHTDPEASVN